MSMRSQSVKGLHKNNNASLDGRDRYQSKNKNKAAQGNIYESSRMSESFDFKSLETKPQGYI